MTATGPAVTHPEHSIAINPSAVWIDVEVEERLVTKVEVRTIDITAGHIHQPIDATERVDELGVRHPVAVDLDRRVLRQRRTPPRTSTPKSLITSLQRLT